MALGAFTTMAFLTKNSFLDEIRKQYVITARSKGLGEREVLYGHIFRNAMLLIIAGFPGAFVSAFFSGSLLIETIFSLDGLGLLGFESAIKRAVGKDATNYEQIIYEGYAPHGVAVIVECATDNPTRTVASVRSTEWVVEATGAGTAVFSIEGPVAVLSPLGSVTLATGDGTDVRLGAAPTQPVQWGQARVDRTLARVPF